MLPNSTTAWQIWNGNGPADRDYDGARRYDMREADCALCRVQRLHSSMFGCLPRGA